VTVLWCKTKKTVKEKNQENGKKDGKEKHSTTYEDSRYRKRESREEAIIFLFHKICFFKYIF
jgi:hypothetical protein